MAPYHPDFWMLVGTAAPVVVLSAIVSAGTAVRDSLKKSGSDRSQSRTNVIALLTAVASLVAIFNILLQLNLIGYAMKSLANGRNYYPPASAAHWVDWGILLLLFGAVASGTAAGIARK
jgi:hypothetical protein